MSCNHSIDEQAEEEQMHVPDTSPSNVDNLLSQIFDGKLLHSRPVLSLSAAKNITKPIDPISRLYLLIEGFSNNAIVFDAYLHPIVERIFANFSTGLAYEDPRSIFCYNLLYLCSRIRGHKAFSHYFPTSIEWFRYNLNVTYQLYVLESGSCKDLIELKYCTVLWMDQLLKLPFKLLDLDPSKVGRVYFKT